MPTRDRLILRANGEGFWQYAPLPGRRLISTAAYRNLGGVLLGPLTTELRFTYDGLGNLREATRTERNQEVHTTREYDGLGRVISEITDLGDAQYGVTFDFAAQGRLSNVLAYELTDPNSTTVRDDISLSLAYDGVLQTGITGSRIDPTTGTTLSVYDFQQSFNGLVVSEQMNVGGLIEQRTQERASS